jgi:poly(A) polymerase
MADLILPDAPWRQREGLPALLQALDGARFVGGAVRDTLLGLPVSDIDLATPLTPTAVLERLAAAGIRAVPTGLAHGTVTAVLAGGPVEVTTLRRDVATDGRHATIAFTDDWRADAARRDFTINALYADPLSGALFDWFDGRADLLAGRVRFIGDPLRRIAEDHLRILRFFRFLARFGRQPDAAGLAACAARANDLMALSRERVRDELLKLLVARDALAVVRLMLDHRILAPVLPEIADTDRLARLIAREAAAGLLPDPLRRLAALLPAAAVEGVGARLKLSNADRKRLAGAVQPLPSADPHILAYHLGEAGASDRLLLSDGEDAAVLAALRAVAGFTPPVFPVTGGMLVARGLSRGPVVAATLKQVEARWIAEGFPDAARAAELADAAVAQALGAASIR